MCNTILFIKSFHQLILNARNETYSAFTYILQSIKYFMIAMTELASKQSLIIVSSEQLLCTLGFINVLVFLKLRTIKYISNSIYLDIYNSDNLASVSLTNSFKR